MFVAHEAFTAVAAAAAFTFNSSGIATHLDCPSDTSPSPMTLTRDASGLADPNRVVGCTKLTCGATSAGTAYRVVRSSSSSLLLRRYQSNRVSSSRPAVAAVVRKKR